jgi:hypothetical protein
VYDAAAAAVVARVARDARRGLAAGAIAIRTRATAFACASQMATHADDLAREVADSGILSDCVEGCVETNAAYPAESSSVREAAASCLLAISSKTPDLAESLVDAGGVESLTQNLSMAKGGILSVFAARTAGYVADFKPSLATAVLRNGDGGRTLIRCLESAETGDVAAACAWALGCIARHGTPTASVLAQHGALNSLLKCYVGVQADRHPTLREKAKHSLKCLIKSCGGLEIIDPLISPETPGPILRHVLAEFAERLGKDVTAKRAFVTSGGLMRLQGVLKSHEKDAVAAAKIETASKKGEAAVLDGRVVSVSSAAIGLLAPLLDERSLRDAKKINSVFPPDVVSYYLYC